MKVLISSAVSNFDDKILKIWGLEKWEGMNDEDLHVLFFGLYVDYDFDVFYFHSGKKTVFWCGSDIVRVLRDPERQRKLRLYPEAEHYCENELEAEELRSVGINPIVAPSFLEDIDDFPASYFPTEKPHIYLSGHDYREEEYGFGLVDRLADRFPDYTFHLYGVGEPYIKGNIVSHGRVSPEQFNEEIKHYQCGLRPNDHDGFSEVTAKSVLMGQYPITKIPYPNILSYQTEEELVELLGKLKFIKEPNLVARDYWRKAVNNYSWMKK